MRLSRVLPATLAAATGVALAVAAIPASGAVSPPGRHGAHHAVVAGDADLPDEVLRDLAAVRQATAPFHDVTAAQAAGWPADATGCLAFPDGYMSDGPGAMGLHYINFTAFNDGGALDIRTPEALLYEPQADGSVRLTAVEYVIPERDLPRTAPAPVLFGRELMFHPEFGAWAVHVWLWRHNPYGLFADVNPDVSCRYATA